MSRSLEIFIGRKGYDAEGIRLPAIIMNVINSLVAMVCFGVNFMGVVSNKTIKNLGLTNDSNGNGLFDDILWMNI